LRGVERRMPIRCKTRYEGGGGQSSMRGTNVTGVEASLFRSKCHLGGRIVFGFIKSKGGGLSHLARVDVLSFRVQSRLSYSELTYPCLHTKTRSWSVRGTQVHVLYSFMRNVF
jgi:hypothetical protein